MNVACTDEQLPPPLGPANRKETATLGMTVVNVAAAAAAPPDGAKLGGASKAQFAITTCDAALGAAIDVTVTVGVALAAIDRVGDGVGDALAPLLGVPVELDVIVPLCESVLLVLGDRVELGVVVPLGDGDALGDAKATTRWRPSAI